MIDTKIKKLIQMNFDQILKVISYLGNKTNMGQCFRNKKKFGQSYHGKESMQSQVSPNSSRRRRSALRARTSPARWRSVASCCSSEPVPSIIDVLRAIYIISVLLYHAKCYVNVV